MATLDHAVSCSATSLLSHQLELLHPQTLLATKYTGEDLDDPYGYPLQLRASTKLGFKQPKWITPIEATNTYRGGYWEDLGFNWFSKI